MDARSSRYHEVYAHWQRSPEIFWAEAAADIDWYEKPKKIFDASAGIYGRLLSEVQLLGAILREFGVEKGDRVIIYMPMIPEAVFAMLACARIGAVHSVVFGGFAAKELATRIDDCQPKVILSASCGIEGARVVPY